jgi:hypothetical protein
MEHWPTMSPQSDPQLQESSPASQTKFPQTIPPDELDATLDEADDAAEVVAVVVVVVATEEDVADVVEGPLPVVSADVFVMFAAVELVGPADGPLLFVEEVVPGAPPSPPSPVSPSSSSSSKTAEPFAHAP